MPRRPRRGEQRESYQFRALIRQRFSLKLADKASNFCQLCVPLFLISIVGCVGLAIEALTREFAGSNTVIVTPPVAINPFRNWPFRGNEYYEWFLFSESELPENDHVGFLDSDGEGSGLLGNVQQNNLILDNDSIIWIPFAQESTTPTAIDDYLYFTQSNMRANPAQTSSNFSYSASLPDGSLLFHNATQESLNYTVQYPQTDYENYNYLRAFLRQNMIYSKPLTSIINLINSAQLRLFAPDSGLNVSIQSFPFYITAGDASVITSYMLMVALPFSISLLIPNFVHLIVHEKEYKLRELMKMNGLKMRNYWFLTFFFDLALCFLLFLLIMFVGLAFRISFFTDPFPIIMLMFFWSLALVSFSFFLSAFIHRNRTITAFVLYMLVIVSVAISFGLSVYFGNEQVPFYVLLYPPFACYRAIYLMTSQCLNSACFGISTFFSKSSIIECVVFLVGHWFVFGLLGIYLDGVLSQPFGVKQHPLWPLHAIRDYFNTPPNQEEEESNFKSSKQEEGTVQINKQKEKEKEIVKNISESEFDERYDDDDVVQERSKILAGTRGDCSILISNLTKKYDEAKGTIAVDRLFLGIEAGECFGLLGPNGSGKTTSISMLTGLFGPTEGTAFVDRFDIRFEMDKVHQVIGVCPQFDIHWPHLTVLDHLLFYARLKGVKPKDELTHCVSLAAELGLEKTILERRSSELSGGLQRRLSIAISLIGFPSIVFLDEPTTGLDTTSRRNLWEVLQKHRQNKCMILVSHNLDEVDVLCSRIGIIARGRLRALGTNVHLKNKFGSGYSIHLNVKEEQAKEADEFLKSLVPHAELVNSVGSYRMYRAPKSDILVSKFMSEMDKQKQKVGIEVWSISSTSLEEVFLRICAEHENPNSI